MKLSILLLSTLITLPAHAEIKNTERSFFGRIAKSFSDEPSDLQIKIKGDDYILYGSAEEKEQTLKEISRFSGKRVTGNFDINEPLIINSIMPNAITENKYTRHLLNGPNCHNNALITTGLMTRRMYVGDSEIQQQLELNCQEVYSPRAGDSGLQYSSGKVALHSYVVFTNNLSYEKRDVAGDRFPKFKTFETRKGSDTFYRCNKVNLERSCSQEVKVLSKKVDKLHLKTGKLIEMLRDPNDRHNSLELARELKAKLYQDNTCLSHQELMETRLESIIAAYIEIEMTGAIYGRGTYDKGPRI